MSEETPESVGDRTARHLWMSPRMKGYWAGVYGDDEGLCPYLDSARAEAWRKGYANGAATKERIEMNCPQCKRQLVGVEYDWRDPEYYDGISEWACFRCGYRRGRWSGILLGEGEKEPKYGRKR